MSLSQRRRPWAPYAAVALAAGLLSTACGGAPKAATKGAPHYKGSSLPTTAGKVHLTEPLYRGSGLALYTAAARYFRWPLLVPAPAAALKGPLSAQVSRFFGGTFDVGVQGRVTTVAGSVMQTDEVLPAAYQARILYRLHGRPVTLFEAVNAYVGPKGARTLALPGGASAGTTWLGTVGPGGPDTRYVEGRRGGLWLMAYGPSAHLSAAALSGLFAHLRQVPLPAGPAPRVKG